MGVLDASAAGRPGLTLLGGEAGVGKTRLVTELEQRAQERGFLVLHGECIEFGGDELPYVPIRAALRDVPVQLADAALAQMPAESRGELAALLPATSLSGAAAGDGPSASSFGQSRLYELVMELLRELARSHGPVLTVFEDVHWADRSSREFLAFFARNLREERLALVVTYRTDEMDDQHPLRVLLSELVRRPTVQRVLLERLDRDDTARQLEAIAGGPVATSLVEELYALSDGNPFFVEELLAARSAGDRVKVPQSIAEIERVRLGRLDSDAQALLALAAVAGGRIGYELLAQIAPVDDLSSALRAALDAHILVRERDDRGVAFRHALMGEVIYVEILLPHERTELHRTLVAGLMQMPQTEPAQIAYHCHRAGEHRAALSASVSAGIEAARVYAFAEARVHFERAIGLWDTVLPDRDVTPLDKVELLARAAQAARFSGDPEQAIALCRQAIAEIDVVAEPLRAAMLHERLGEYHYWDDKTAFECYEQALAIIPSDPTPERARLLAAEGHALMGLRRWTEARERCEEALAIAERIGDGRHEANARVTLGLVLEFLGEGEAEQHLRRAMQIAKAVGANEEIARAHLHLAELYRLRGEHEAALKVMVDGEQIAARMGMSASLGNFMHVNATDDLFRLGRWDEVELRLADSERMDLGVTAAAMHHEISGHLAALRGDTATADAAFERVDVLVEQGLPCECVTTAAIAATARALVAGEPREARRRVARAVERVGDAQDPLYSPPLYALGMRAEADLAEQARALRRDADVHAARSRANELASDLERVLQCASGGVPPDAAAYRDLTQAELSRVEGEPRVELWRQAAAAFEPLGQPYPMAYARLRQAEALLQSRQDRAAAADLLIDAHEIALALGAEPLRHDIEALARRAKLDLSPPAAEPPETEADPLAALGVTRRERDVLELLCEGLSNRQIAKRLFISEKTVSTHLGHIFDKLGVHSRHEAVTVCQRLGGQWHAT